MNKQYTYVASKPEPSILMAIKPEKHIWTDSIHYFNPSGNEE